MADKQPLVYPHMPPPERAAFCARAPWWTAPVIVGGSGGSGTRGAVLLLQQLGVGMACEDAIFDTKLFDPATHCNRAKDFDLMGGRRQRMPPLVWFTASQNRSEPHQPSCSVDGGEVAHAPTHRACACACACACARACACACACLILTLRLSPSLSLNLRLDLRPSPSSMPGQVESLSKALEANPSEKGFSMERLTALRASILPAYRQPLRWGMKNPHSTYILSLLLRYFPCLACVHSLALG